MVSVSERTHPAVFRRATAVARLARWVVFPLASAVLLAGGILRLLDAFGWPLNIYDEGVLLTDSWLVGKGRTPFADFFTDYPPGIYHLIHGWWVVFGASIASERLLGAAIHILIAALAGRIAGRIAGKPFSWLAGGIVLFWLGDLGVIAFAWMAALCVALAWIELSCAAYTRSSRVLWVLSGVALGAVGAFRHDLFVCLLVALVGGGVLHVVITRSLPRRSSLIPAGWVALGAIGPLLLVYGPVILAGAFSPMVKDLYSYQVRYVEPHRGLPFPSLLTPTSHLYPLPVFLSEDFQGAVALTLIAPALAIIGALRRWSAKPLPVVLLAVLSVAVLPQLLGRTDVTHALYTVTPGLILAVGFFERLSIRRLVPCLVALVGISVLTIPIEHQLRSVSFAQASVPSLAGRLSGLAELSPAALSTERKLIAYVDFRVRPNQRTFVALTDNSTTSTNEIVNNDMSLYFLADRESATRFMQFDPGLSSRASIQRQVISGLERWHPPAVVLVTNGPRVGSGSRLLDQYLRREYVFGRRFGSYYVERRRPSAEHAG